MNQARVVNWPAAAAIAATLAGLSAFNWGLGPGLLLTGLALVALWLVARRTGAGLGELALVPFIAFLPLSLSEFGRFTYRGEEIPIYLALLPLLGLCALLAGWRGQAPPNQHANRTRAAWLFLFWLTLAASTFVSSDRRVTLIAVITMAGNLASYWVLARLTRRDLWLKLLAVYLAALTLPLGVALYNFFFVPTSNYRLSFTQVVDNPNQSAYLMEIAIFIAVGVAFVRRWSWSTGLALACAGVLGYSFILTGSRAGWLALAVGLPLLFILLGRRLQWRRLVVLLVVAALLTPLVVPRAIILRAQSFFSPLATTLTDAGEIIPAPPDTGRYAIWRVYWQEVERSPWRGIGLGYYIETIEGYRSAHNSYLSAWVSAGIFCLLTFLIILAYHGWRLWQARATARADLWWCILVAAFVAALIHLVFENYVFTQFFWTLLGLQAAGAETYLAAGAAPAQVAQSPDI